MIFFKNDVEWTNYLWNDNYTTKGKKTLKFYLNY
jgi:hypothetical protein